MNPVDPIILTAYVRFENFSTVSAKSNTADQKLPSSMRR